MELSKAINNDVCTVSIEGRLDTTTAPAFEEYLTEIFPEGLNLVFDFENLAYISSAGLRVLLLAQKEVNKKGNTLVLKNVSDVIYEILEITGFADMMTIERS